ncbi:hypothetical protein BUN12_3644 [Bacillus amyloliquefaciens]|jgi:Na+/phosphate symporter|uniref:hypothetical protein n=1 Tax=Bacillus amyloliquefaciens TaxID=1390 RepID=UPI00080209D3|nr:hypothetical protein [Bacillus amyloliquefaciens]ARW37640.1 hypothetical protein S101267_00524 [Bacillus amyloliquefaciens]AZV91888.1 hypothetical protein BUN12_3644 [Bacillus amyloliquefaciens]MEC1841549.1 hypothetical protein [Bacillus amyloliquefaciens]MEC1849663.1 hypothetical protein [Bacillus amyloliquefaciens]MEC1927680.1 hypothetical protein [Bacillus amyloliquefaciens]
MVNVNFLNPEFLERELESIGHLDLFDEIIEQMQENAPHEESFIVQVTAEVNGFYQKVYAVFSIVEEDELEEQHEKDVHFEVIGYSKPVAQ